MITRSKLLEQIAVQVRCGENHEYIKGSNDIATSILSVLSQHICLLTEGDEPMVGDVVIYKRGEFPYEVAPTSWASCGITIRNSSKEIAVGALDLRTILHDNKPCLTLKK